MVELGHEQGCDAPEQGHGAGRLGVVGQGQGRGGIALLREHQGGTAGIGRDDQQRGVQAPGYQAGGLDDALGDRLDPAGPGDRGPSVRTIVLRRPGLGDRLVQGCTRAGPCEQNRLGLAAIRLIMATASAGYWPIAVSPESITASVPSSTALKTSLASARVGRLVVSMLLSIWVAVITGTRAGGRRR